MIMKEFLFITIGFFIVLSNDANCQKRLLSNDKSFHQKPSGTWTIDWSADDTYIASGGDDSLLRVYDAATLSLAKVYRTNGMIRQLSWHPQKNQLAVATVTDALSVLDVGTDNIMPLKNVQDGARGIGWNFDGTLLAAADGEGTVRIWDVKGNLKKSFPKDDQKSYLSLHWHPTKNILITGGDEIRMFEADKGLLKIIKHRKEETGVLTVRWHPSGKFFVSGDYGHHEEGIESLLQFWKEDGSLIKTIRASKKEYRIVAWNHGGEWLATSGDALRIWTKDGEKIFEDTSGHSFQLWGMAWSKDDSKLVTTDFDGKINLIPNSRFKIQD